MVRLSASRLASSISKKPLPSSALPGGASPPQLKSLADQLLPPIPLYRRLLRVHRKALPIEMRVLGDDYIKAEFRRTRSTDNAIHVMGFLSEWKKYLDYHENQLLEGEAGVDAATQRREGQKLQEELFEKLSSEQMGQLYELLQATKEVWSDAESIERERQEAKKSVSESAK